MKNNRVEIVSEMKDLGFMKLAVVKDPDGNTVEFTELSKGWFDHLKKRRSEGHDLITHYNQLNP